MVAPEPKYADTDSGRAMLVGCLTNEIEMHVIKVTY